MYSVILMAALSTNGPDAVSFGHKARYAGCGGCYGGSCWGCGGCNGCGGCYGCGGCWGGGSCIGGGGWPYYGGCYGWYTGGWHCYGGTACYGGCYGSCMGCQSHYAGCYGGCHGAPQPIWYHGHGHMYRYHDAGNPMVAPSGAAPKAEPITPPKGTTDSKPMGGAAKLILEVPADAQLFVDDLPMKGSATTRQFSTPMLEAGQIYYYNVRVDATRDGQQISETRRVLVRAHEQVHESFVAGKSAVAKASH